MKLANLSAFKPLNAFHRAFSASAIKFCYPKVKAKYPEGFAATGSSAQAWQYYEQKEQLLKCQDAKWRLERLSGTQTSLERKEATLWAEDTILMVKSDPYALVTPCLDHHQYIMKTKLMANLPDMYADVSVEEIASFLKPHVFDAISSYMMQQQATSSLEKDFQFRHDVIGCILKTILAYTSSDNKHLLRSQLDEKCRMEAFWKRSGYEAEDFEEMEECCDDSTDILRFQLQHNCNWQIRTELPLPEVCSPCFRQPHV